jgi:hypothetical protein
LIGEWGDQFLHGKFLGEKGETEEKGFGEE